MHKKKHAVFLKLGLQLLQYIKLYLQSIQKLSHIYNNNYI